MGFCGLSSLFGVPRSHTADPFSIEPLPFTYIRDAEERLAKLRSLKPAAKSEAEKAQKMELVE